jgi:hypothetical protein
MTDAVPSWVRALCRHDFFSACAGQHDRASSRPPVHNLFCVDCELQVCPECADSEHEGHRILKVRRIIALPSSPSSRYTATRHRMPDVRASASPQIRRASMQDAVLLEEIRECEDFDVSDIQVRSRAPAIFRDAPRGRRGPSRRDTAEKQQRPTACSVLFPPSPVFPGDSPLARRPSRSLRSSTAATSCTSVTTSRRCSRPWRRTTSRAARHGASVVPTALSSAPPPPPPPQ